jgi:hypothetical protein
VCHKVLDEILFPITNTSFRPDEASSAAARKPQAFQEEMAWPPVLVLQGCSSEFDSSGKLDAKFRGQGVTKTAPMFTPSFCGQAVLCFGESNGSLLAEAYEKAKNLKENLSSAECTEVRTASWLTRKDYDRWKTQKWAKKVLSWADQSGLSFVNKAAKDEEIRAMSEQRRAEVERVAMGASLEASELKKAREAEEEKRAELLASLEKERTLRNQQAEEHQRKKREQEQQIDEERLKVRHGMALPAAAVASPLCDAMCLHLRCSVVWLCLRLLWCLHSDAICLRLPSVCVRLPRGHNVGVCPARLCACAPICTGCLCFV